MRKRGHAVVVHTRRYSETSLIATLLTREFGIVRCMAKGALRPGQPLAGRLDLFHEGVLVFRPARQSSLHTLVEFDVENHHASLRQDYTRVLCLTYFYDLLARTLESDVPAGDFFETFRLAVEYLDTREVSLRFIERYERRVMACLGIDDGRVPTRVLLEQAGSGLPESYRLLREEMDRSGPDPVSEG